MDDMSINISESALRESEKLSMQLEVDAPKIQQKQELEASESIDSSADH